MGALVSMITPGIKCNVTGRYMDGTNVVAYHLVGTDGSQEKASKERVIYLIQRGSLQNMRIQVVDNVLTVRGKGQNLTELPVWDESKRCFRNDAASKAVAQSSVRTNAHYENQMGQFTIIKRIMFKNNCVGYILKDTRGVEIHKSRDDVLNLAVRRLISNATAQKTSGHRKDEKTGQLIPCVKTILRGSSINLNELPVMIIDPTTGKIVDPSAMIDQATCRAMYVKANGVIKDKKTSQVMTFRAGDYLICYGRGDLAVRTQEEIKQQFKSVKDTDRAACDDYIDSRRYMIEVFGGKTNWLSAEIIKKWNIVKKNNT